MSDNNYDSDTDQQPNRISRFDFHDLFLKDAPSFELIGRSETGKSWLTRKILLWYQVQKRIRRENVYIVKDFYSDDDYKAYPKENRLTIDQIPILKKIIKARHKYVETHSKKKLELMAIVFDDITSDAKKGDLARQLEKLYTTARHVRCMVFTNIHHISKLDVASRSMATFYIITNVQGTRMSDGIKDQISPEINSKIYYRFLQKNCVSDLKNKHFNSLIFSALDKKYYRI